MTLKTPKHAPHTGARGNGTTGGGVTVLTVVPGCMVGGCPCWYKCIIPTTKTQIQRTVYQLAKVARKPTAPGSPVGHTNRGKNIVQVAKMGRAGIVNRGGGGV